MTTKKFDSKEIKVALAFIAALIILIVGINFLKGINVFMPTNHYFIKFERLDGLVVSNNVYIKGYKVGQVRSIDYDFTNEHKPFTVNFAINEDINIPLGTVAYLFDESLMGGKGINIILNNNKSNHTYGDTLSSGIEIGLLGSMSEMVPQLKNTISNIDSLVNSVNHLVNSPDIDNSLQNLNSITNNLKYTTNSINGLLKNDIPTFLSKANSIANNLDSATNDLKDVQFKDIALSVDSTINNLNAFTKQLNNPNSSLGLLLNDKKLYNNIESATNSANLLLIDLKENPKRYVHFSLFGRKNQADK